VPRPDFPASLHSHREKKTRTDSRWRIVWGKKGGKGENRAEGSKDALLSNKRKRAFGPVFALAAGLEEEGKKGGNHSMPFKTQLRLCRRKEKKGGTRISTMAAPRAKRVRLRIAT